MEILNEFGINPILLAAQAVNFAILLFILKKFMYKPILKVLEERKKRIAESLKNAEEIEKRLQETNEKIDAMIGKAANEAQKIIDESKKEGVLYLEETKIRAGRMAEELIKKSEEAARAETAKMQQEVMNKVAEIVAVGLQKVTGKILNKKDQREIIERSVKNLS
ncbi:MAG: F0F1 ATP synthase subunit B [Candidatus Daviesbacteria bacterium]|nr:F0F1 ATP synthase subunit B [Candidatus Daviesbacteria bacterium]